MKFRINIVLTFVFAFLYCISIISQDEIGFQRIFAADNYLLINTSSAPTDDGGFYMASVGLDMQNVFNIVVTRHDIKGDITWSNKYQIDNAAFFLNLTSIDIDVVEDNNLFVLASSLDLLLGLRDEKYMFKIDGDGGDILWSNILEDEQSTIHGANYNIVTTFDNTEHSNVFSSQLDSLTFGIQHNRFSVDNNLVSDQTYVITDTFKNTRLAALLDAHHSIDSSHTILFASDSASQVTGALKINSLGIPEFVTGYSVDQDSFPMTIFQLFSINPTPDTASVMTGIVQNIMTQVVNNVVCKIDTNGNVQWAKIIDNSTSILFSQVNDVITTVQNEIVVTGKYLGMDLLAGDFAIFFDLNGNVIRQVNYQSDNSFLIDLNTGLLTVIGELSHSSDGNTFYSTTGLDFNGGLLANYIIKMDSVGNAMCSDTFDIGLISDLTILQDTFSVLTENFGVLDTFEISNDNFTFNTPVLSLSDTMFCPQDPIIYEILGAVPGATGYIWSTGDTTDRITVTEEGEFSVTVTVGDRICYTLCDTSNVSQLDFPQARIAANTDFVCEDDFIRIAAQIMGGAGAREFIWEDGSTDRTRDILSPGDYQVTITDNCDNTATANISLSEDDFIIDFEISITPDFSFVCTEDRLVLTADSDIEVLTYSWSTGESSQSIDVTTPGIYTVSVTSICNDTDERSFEANMEDISPPELNINIVAEPFDCDTGVPLSIGSTTVVNFQSINWSTGEITPSINALTSGDFNVTVTDECGTSDEATITIDIAQFADLAFPNIFFPNSEIEINRTFGPYIECPELFVAENYKLEVFNRWGNKVFESENITDRWNGRVNNMGNLIQEDVYLFVYSYLDESSVEITGNGSVTLSR